ncbi:GDSL-type esterase/lipase family protein [Pedobacter sp.]
MLMSTHRMLKFLLLSLVIPLVHIHVHAQKFDRQIQAFRKADEKMSPARNAILFVGSSSFTKWTDVQAYFPDHVIINRGFGGSTLADLIHYANAVIYPYRPRQVVIYCGDNDFGEKGIGADSVLKRFISLYEAIRENLGRKIQLSYISIKPSPMRWHLHREMEVANALIEKYLKKEKNTDFIDVYSRMLGVDGRPNKEIFLADNLHMNAEGYKMWQEVITPYLIKK